MGGSGLIFLKIQRSTTIHLKQLPELLLVELIKGTFTTSLNLATRSSKHLDCLPCLMDSIE